jgi:hypothetical protein
MDQEGEVDIIQGPDISEVPCFFKRGMGRLYVFLRLDKSDSPELQRLVKELEAYEIVELCLDICSSIWDFSQVKDVVDICHKVCESFEAALQTNATPLGSIHQNARNFAQWLPCTRSIIMACLLSRIWYVFCIKLRFLP